MFESIILAQTNYKGIKLKYIMALNCELVNLHRNSTHIRKLQSNDSTSRGFHPSDGAAITVCMPYSGMVIPLI